MGLWNHNIKDVDRVFSGSESAQLEANYPKTFRLTPENTSGGKLSPKVVRFVWACTNCPFPMTYFFDDGDAPGCDLCDNPKDENHDYKLGIVGDYNLKYVLKRKTLASLPEDSKIEYLVSGLFEGDARTMFSQMEDAV